MSKKVVIEVKDLRVSFRTNQGFVQAVRGVSYKLYKGETLAIVGESGSGKSQTSRSVMGILAGNAVIEGGEVNYEGRNLLKLPEDEFHKIRGNKIGMIFQDPSSSLNPIMRVGRQITEAMILNGNRKKNKYKDLIEPYLVKVVNLNLEISELKENDEIDRSEKNRKIKELKIALVKAKTVLKAKKKEAKKTIDKEYKAYKNEYTSQRSELLRQLKNKSISVLEYKKERKAFKEVYLRKIKVTNEEAKQEAYKIMSEVGIPEPEKRFKMYPFQFSGGMKQRVVIAIALMARPDILICDEPTTALDVTIQAQILDLIKKIKRDRDLSVIFITHNLGVVANIADRVAVMYAGKIVEYGTADDVFYNPQHPYTWALMASMPDINSKDKLLTIPGTPPNMLYPPKGDAFSVRNEHALKIDFELEPPLFKVSESHYAATWLLHEYAPKVKRPEIIDFRIEAMKKEVKRLRGEKNE
jgi:oligopeptide transport system ATP-binding protein